ncbi:MAG: hypothetical protein JSW20_08135 [Nitrospiraceae bacterium]|nr:MAG: hypothetical protein JSW20_08135 [Nitrospiraceae bacterium]
MIIETIKDGFRLANRNLPLVVVRIIVTVINFAGLAVFLGLPVLIAIAFLGFDLAQAKDLLPSMMDNPFDVVSRYLGFVFLLVAAIMLYMVFSSLLILYSFSGIMGVLRSAAVNTQYTFKVSSFFREAGRNFPRLFRVLSLVLLMTLALIIFTLIIGGISATIMNTISGTESTIEVFFSSFITIFIAIMSIVIILASIIFTVYSLVISVVTMEGATASISSAYNFIKEKPQALVFSIILFFGMIAVNAVFFSLQIPIQFMPFMTPFVYLLNALGQSYLIIVMWSSLILYYIKSVNYPVYSAGYEI